MEWLVLALCHTIGVVVVLYTMWILLWPLLLLSLVVVGVVMACRFVAQRLDSCLPGNGRVVLITGCDTGIGHESALAASQRGLTVAAGCLDPHSEGATRLAAMNRIHVIQLDVTRDDSVQAALVEVSRLCGDEGLWAVVNNAGFNRQAPIELMSLDTFHHVADVMLFGTVRVTKAFLPLLRRAKGRVLTMSSDRGMLSPAHSAAYCIAKHGIETFSDVLREEMTSFDVSVCVIQPGHFGGATAIINPQAVEAMRASLERDLDRCTEEVQVAYGGQRLVEGIISNCVASRDFSPSDVTPIVHALMHALLSVRPKHRYPVHGTTGPVDWGIVLGQVKPLVPDKVLGWIQTIIMKK